MKKSGKLFSIVQGKLDNVNNVMQENLTGMRLIKAFIRKNLRKVDLTAQMKICDNETVKALRIVELTAPILLFIMNIGILAILWFGAIRGLAKRH